ncbi:MAG: hypothetical protein AB7U45_02925 [Desulfamplus sp.]
MSKQYPECPLYNHVTCKDLHNPKVCALVREDKTCFKKRQKIKPHENGHDSEQEQEKDSNDENLRRD